MGNVGYFTGWYVVWSGCHACSHALTGPRSDANSGYRSLQLRIASLTAFVKVVLFVKNTVNSRTVVLTLLLVIAILMNLFPKEESISHIIHIQNHQSFLFFCFLCFLLKNFTEHYLSVFDRTSFFVVDKLLTLHLLFWCNRMEWAYATGNISSYGSIHEELILKFQVSRYAFF